MNSILSDEFVFSKKIDACISSRIRAPEWGCVPPRHWIPVGSGDNMIICAKIEPECQPSVSRNDTNLVYFLFLNVSEILHLSHRAPFNIC